MWPILGWRRTLLCRRPSRVFCSELRRESWWHDHAERHHRKTTYQGRSADLSFLLARITNLSHEQLRRLDGLISHMDYKTVFLTAICLANLFLFSVFFFSIPCQHLLSPPHSEGFMCLLSTSSYLHNPEFTGRRARKAPSPTPPKSVMLPVSAIFDKIRSCITILRFKCQPHELHSAKSDGRVQHGSLFISNLEHKGVF